MFIKKLIIRSRSGLIRDINFKRGLNLIIDDTPTSDEKVTGNNVGKTTVLKLIDFCLGAKPNIIYTDTENKKEKYEEVQKYLIDEEVEVELTLTEDIDDNNAKQVKILRNFLSRKKAIREINNEEVLDKEFEDELERKILPNKNVKKPTFRQVISHNIRYRDENINNTLKTLSGFTKDVEYEALYLYLLGCNFDDGATKQSLVTKRNQEQNFKERLEKKQTKNSYVVALEIINDEIDLLNKKKKSLNINENLSNDLERLDYIKYKKSRTASNISKLNIRKILIEESKLELENNKSSIDVQNLKRIYEDTGAFNIKLQKTFEDLMNYHNKMLIEKSRYITKELPELNEKLNELNRELSDFSKEEKELTLKISISSSFEDLENIMSELNEKHRIKGEHESVISQIETVENTLNELDKEIKSIDNYIFSEEFENNLRIQVNKFNKHFSKISEEFYGEKFALTFDKENKKGQMVYKFSSFNMNMSSGKKQGEILCFDLAYLLFSNDENIGGLKFLLNDKKELLHSNQLSKIAEFTERENVQLVVSILKDKLPNDILNSANIAVELSQTEKLFKIEK